MNTMSSGGAGGGGGSKRSKEEKASVEKYYRLTGPLTGKVKKFTGYLIAKLHSCMLALYKVGVDLPAVSLLKHEQ
jgi:hypothetical protein